MIESNHLVSVIIPTYNRAAIITDTIKSVQSQQYSNWECLIVDDYSTDNTNELVKSLARQDNRFKYLKNTRSKGAPGARNTGLFNAKGSYIFFLDSDDLLLPHYIESRVFYFDQNPCTDIVVGLQKRIEDGIETFYLNVASPVHPLVRFYSLYPYSDIPWINNTLIKRNFIVDNNIEWDESVEVHQDIQFNLSLLVKKPIVRWLQTSFDSYWVYKTNRATIGTQTRNEVDTYLKLIEIYWFYLSENKFDYSLRKLIKKQYAALLFYLCQQVSLSDGNNYQIFLKYVKGKSYFTRLDVYLLYTKYRYRNFARLNIYQRVLNKISSEYIKYKFKPVIIKGNFLKIKGINHTDFE